MISLNNNPASVIIHETHARELEAKPSTKLSLSRSKPWRHEVHLNANAEDNKHPTVSEVVELRVNHTTEEHTHAPEDDTPTATRRVRRS